MEAQKIIAPCDSQPTLSLGTVRANYLAYVWKYFRLKDHPPPIGHVWHLANELCLSICYNQPAILSSITLPTMPQDTEENIDGEITDSGSEDIYFNSNDSCIDFEESKKI